MNKRKFGRTDLQVSEVGFGAWAIGGPAMAGDIPIGWGKVDDKQSEKALLTAIDQGINFIDTADFYGLGHSEELIGKIAGNRSDVVIATKVGHRLDNQGSIYFDYSKEYILNACDTSLKRLRRETIDFYQLHSAKVSHMENGECLEALEILQNQGKIRYWGISLNTYHPSSEADYVLNHSLGDGFQLVFNIINQKALCIIEKATKAGYGIIARMPLQFGLLSGKFRTSTRFAQNDHRHFRLKPAILEKSIENLDQIWPLTEKYGISATQLSLSFILSFSQISTVIPGIKTAEQARENSTGLVSLEEEDLKELRQLYETKFSSLLSYMEKEESL
ncbi:MAG: aldo/keto reductase [Calditrichia bacterium]|nr:aldo/keto reductase [Calditrichia bacterium]